MNRNVLIIGAVGIVILGLIAGFLFTRGGQKEKVVPTPTPTPEVVVELLPKDALVVSLTKGRYPRYVLTIDNIVEGTIALSYEITYDTTDKGTQGITTGTPIAIKEGQKKYVNSEIVFGSESRGKYSLDEGVSNIQINIRLTFKDGSEKGWKGNLEI